MEPFTHPTVDFSVVSFGDIGRYEFLFRLEFQVHLVSFHEKELIESSDGFFV